MAERLEEGSDAGADVVGPRREDRQLTVLGGVLAARHGRVDERDVGTLLVDECRDTLDARHADRAHLHPDRTGRERRQHPLVGGGRDDRVGVGHHRHDDRGSPSRVRRALRDFRAQCGEVAGRVRRTVPDDGRDPRAQRAGCHAVPHRPDADHRNRFTRTRHRSLPPQVGLSPTSVISGVKHAFPVQWEPHADA